MAGKQEGNVRRPHPGLDEQLILEGHDLHQVHARLDNAADGVDGDDLHRAFDRGPDFGAGDPVLGGSERLLQHPQAHGFIIDRGLGRRAELGDPFGLALIGFR